MRKRNQIVGHQLVGYWRLLLLGVIVVAVAGVALVLISNGSEAGMDKGNEVEHSSKPEIRNHLADENSPYLLSHADNPVDWYPWTEEALARAKAEDKPIFLSIGYAACHWCHVMERESFENEQIAAILNENFISIKVDREQRPDLDNIYMAFTTAMTGGGGWPMTVFLTPDLKPFFAGTYFPPDDRFGRPGFKRVITEIASVYKKDKAKIIASSEYIVTQLSGRLNGPTGSGVLTSDLINRAADRLMKGFDQVNGGFGQAPKFPHPVELSLFLRYSYLSDKIVFRTAALKALRNMARGGIYDQIGGGFARYATDARWLVPHFEKMLYDNGLLVPVYVQAYQLTGDMTHLATVRGTLDFILREMTDKTGGFYSSLDADSEHEEGKFYVWSKSEVDTLLGKRSGLFCEYYNITDRGNFEGHNILHLSEASDRLREESNVDDIDRQMAEDRAILFAERSKRIRPATDDKILTSWNGLALYALCKGYQVTNDSRYLEAAIANAEFVRTQLFREGRLTHAYREGIHSDDQFLEDYAFYLRGLLELYQTDHSDNSRRWLDFAVMLADTGVELFMASSGTLYLTEDNQPDLIMRPKDETDGALPSPGSFFITDLLKLSRLTGVDRFAAAGEKGLMAISGLLNSQPQTMASGLDALDFYLSDKVEIVIVGNGNQRRLMVDELNRRFLPNRLLAVSNTGEESGPLFEGRRATDGETWAFVCRNSVCQLPVSTVEEFREQLAIVYQ